MTAADSNNTPTTTLLTLLHQYSALHNTASTNFKSTLWNITKARRGRGYQSSCGPLGTSEYSVESVREELEATALIEVKKSDGKEEPELMDEHDDVNDNNYVTDNLEVNYLLHFDGNEGIKREAAKKALNNDANNEECSNSNSNQEGLRRRKNKGGSNTDESNAAAWIEEEPTIESQKASPDPLQLFGVPPPALRVAQSHSRDALAYYVEVANVARKIMTIVQEGE
ncbi:hypothetical protein ACHAWT_009147 [Skeletonema menzelii]